MRVKVYSLMKLRERLLGFELTTDGLRPTHCATPPSAKMSQQGEVAIIVLFNDARERAQLEEHKHADDLKAAALPTAPRRPSTCNFLVQRNVLMSLSYSDIRTNAPTCILLSL